MDCRLSKLSAAESKLLKELEASNQEVAQLQERVVSLRNDLAVAGEEHQESVRVESIVSVVIKLIHVYDFCRLLL